MREFTVDDLGHGVVVSCNYDRANLLTVHLVSVGEVTNYFKGSVHESMHQDTVLPTARSNLSSPKFPGSGGVGVDGSSNNYNYA